MRGGRFSTAWSRSSRTSRVGFSLRGASAPLLEGTQYWWDMRFRLSVFYQWLRDPRIADLAADAVLIGDSERRFYDLVSWVVMPNHVHLLILPLKPVSVLTRWIKGSTARSANKILGRTGQPFWQDESYDHYLRTSTRNLVSGLSPIDRTVAYIEENPVSAGLVSSAELWPWSSAGRQAKPPWRKN